LGSRPWENPFVKVPYTGLKKVIYIKEGSEVISNEPPLKKWNVRFTAVPFQLLSE